MHVAIETQNLCKIFYDKIAVNNLNLKIPVGQLTCLVGRNGSGKSTLINLLTTLLRPSRGKALIAGYDTLRNSVDVRRSIGVVLQELSLDKNMTVMENLYLAGALYGVSRNEVKAYAEEMLNLVNMTGVQNKKIYHLSGGMKRMVDVIRSILHKPQILIFDELTSGIDFYNSHQIWNFIHTLVESYKTTILLTTHHLEEVTLCHKMVLIDQGELQGEWIPQHLIKEMGRFLIDISATDMKLLYQDFSQQFGEPIIMEDRYLFRTNQTNLSIDDLNFLTKTSITHIALRSPNLNDIFSWLHSSSSIK